MLLIYDITTDPNWNLAAEEYLLENFSESVFRLWRNADSIIVGRNQNAYAEIDTEWVSNKVPVVRRMTEEAQSSTTSAMSISPFRHKDSAGE